MVKRIATFLALLLSVTAAAPSAHPLHTSFTEITRERGGTFAVSIRLFADDFGAALDSLRSATHGSTVEAVAQQYLARSVAIIASDGKPVPLTWCGMRSDEGLIWLCARSAQPVPSGKLRIRNALMFDRFSDQISIVRWARGSGTRTLVLSARAPEALLD